MELTRAYLEHHMERVLVLWRQFFPAEVTAFEERAAFDKWQDEGRSRKQELRSKGNIPLRIYLHFCRIDPEFWQNKRNSRMFWRLYPKAETAARRIMVGG